ncbi:hypothetical protein JX266_007226 [Neoarthrinium moseri]|nr:hypothetical protein JX266_007226 [Neoarthrinium moseri]
MALTAWLMQAEPNRKLITEPIKIGPHRLTSDYSRGLQGTPALERATILEVDSETPEEWTTVTHPRLHGNFSETRTQDRQNENDLVQILHQEQRMGLLHQPPTGQGSSRQELPATRQRKDDVFSSSVASSSYAASSRLRSRKKVSSLHNWQGNQKGPRRLSPDLPRLPRFEQFLAV